MLVPTKADVTFGGLLAPHLSLWTFPIVLCTVFLLWQHHIQELTQRKGKFGDISLEAEDTCLTGDTLPDTGLRT